MAVLQSNISKGKQLSHLSMLKQKKKKQSNTRIRGGETPCILKAWGLQKADKNSFVKKQINFYQAVQRFSFLRLSSLLTLNALFSGC